MVNQDLTKRRTSASLIVIERTFFMKTLSLMFWLLLVAGPALANSGGVANGGVGNGNGNGNHLHRAPAPLIGYGLPSALVVGAGLLGANFLARKRRWTPTRPLPPAIGAAAADRD
jgi:hypothetical protein